MADLIEAQKLRPRPGSFAGGRFMPVQGSGPLSEWRGADKSLPTPCVSTDQPLPSGARECYESSLDGSLGALRTED